MTQHIIRVTAIAASVVLVFSVVANIAVGAHVADVGIQIHQTGIQSRELRAKQNDLLLQIADSTSLTRMHEEALAKGFVARGKVVVIRSQENHIARLTQ